MMYIIQMRSLGIRDLTFALRDKENRCASLEPFERAGLLVELKPEQERDFVEKLVETHPTHEKNFEHFLVDPPDKILPTDILEALRTRSDIIPTLCVVQTQEINGIEKVISIERVRDHYELFSLLSDAEADGLVTLAKGGPV